MLKRSAISYSCRVHAVDMYYITVNNDPVNDSMTITPLVYIKEFPIGTNDETGLMVKSSFRF